MNSLAAIACTALHVLALAIWFGTAVLARALHVDALGTRAARIGFPLAALLTGVAWVPLQAASLFEFPLASRQAADASLVLLSTGLGRMWLLHLVPAAVGVIAILVRAGAERLLFLLSAAALGSLAFQGHAAAVPGEAGLAMRLATSLHILAAGAWAGSLPALAALCSRTDARSLAGVLRAYSRLGILLVATLLASGVGIALAHLGGDARVAARSGYGQLLEFKVLLVGIMGALAIRNRNRHTPALDAGDPQRAAYALLDVRKSIRLEAAIGFAVIAIAVVLAGTEAPGD